MTKKCKMYIFCINLRKRTNVYFLSHKSLITCHKQNYPMIDFNIPLIIFKYHKTKANLSKVLLHKEKKQIQQYRVTIRRRAYFTIYKEITLHSFVKLTMYGTKFFTEIIGGFRKSDRILKDEIIFLKNPEIYIIPVPDCNRRRK